MKRILLCLIVSAVCCGSFPFVGRSLAQPIIVDHRHRDPSKIPQAWIEAAKHKVAWVYGHTSHGSQVVDGANYLSQYKNPPVYNFIDNWQTIPEQGSPEGLRMGDDGSWSWSSNTFLNTARARLNADHSNDPAGQIRVFMWSWCGQMSDDGYISEDPVAAYLGYMAQLETEYPNVIFVYMTGHTDSGNPELLAANNERIREYVRENNKVLYDFADIESWLPDGTAYADPNDSCPWCQDWCDNHPGYCPDQAISCAHSHSLNCMLKGQAFWWLSARLAGWSGQTGPAGGSVSLLLDAE